MHIICLATAACALATAPLSAAQSCPQDDRFSGNFTIDLAEEVALTPGLTSVPDLALVNSFIDDYFSFDLAFEDSLTITFGAPTIFQFYDVRILDEDLTVLSSFQVQGSGGDFTINEASIGGGRYVLEIGSSSSTCIDYRLDFFVSFCTYVDFFEDFDTCEDSFRLFGAEGTLQSLAVTTSDWDYFSTVVAPGERLDVAAIFDHGRGDIDLALREFTDTCGPLVLAAASVTDNESLQFLNDSPESKTMVIGVERRMGGTGCTEYSLNWSVVAAACADPDVFSGNHTFCDAVLLGDSVGLFPDLNVSAAAPDYFSLDGGEIGEQWTVSVDFDEAQASLGVQLVLPGAGCEEFNDFVAVSSSGSLVVGPVPGDLSSIWGVKIFVESGDCTPYQLSVTRGITGDIGGRICDGTINSTGSTARIQSSGSLAVDDNWLVLDGTRLPPSTFGIFLTSRAYEIQPMVGGFAGTLCLGAPIGRLDNPGQVVFSDGMGQVSLDVNLQQLPQGIGTVSAQPGETWYFQLWHRDRVGMVATANLSEAIELRFR